MGISSWGCSNPPAIMIAVCLWGSPLCGWPWWMYPVGGEKDRLPALLE